MDRLGVRKRRVALLAGDPRLKRGGTHLAVLEWTINDVPLSELFDATTSVPSLYYGTDLGDRIEALRRLRGDHFDPPVFVRRFERTPLDKLLRREGTPWAPSGPVFEDGRVTLLECPCGDLDCGALTTEVVIGDEVVEWRHIGWQVTYEPFTHLDDVVRSARFDRADYTVLIDDLLATVWTQEPQTERDPSDFRG